MLRQLIQRQTPTRKNKTTRRTRRRLSRASFERLEDRTLLAALPWGPMQGGTPHYYGPEPNWANSPQPTVNPVTSVITGGIQKFVDSLPGMYVAAPTPTERAINLANADNNLGQYIPVAFADTTSYPGMDYYEIALVDYTERMSSSLHPTTLRGYVQLETPVNAGYSMHHPLTYLDGTPILDGNGAQVYSLTAPSYLGPMIVATKDRPTRVKFTNYVVPGTGGDLFIPVDLTEMGAGMGPNMTMAMMADRVYPVGPTVDITTSTAHGLQVGALVELTGFRPEAYNGQYRVIEVCDPTCFRVTLATDPGGPATVLGDVMEDYTSDRAAVHLHGGRTPWISDGTPYQWITPAGESTQYPEGVSVHDVPDVPDPGPGSMTFFYSNQQSARLMFYHDHAFGITRLNVYAGEAAGYLLTDAVEQDLITRGIVPAAEVPLIIQDKTFVDPTAVLTTDPTWPFQLDDAQNNLWYPHVYMPNQNPNALNGANPIGRWDYGPFFWPPWPVANPPLHELQSITVTAPGSGYALQPIVTITPAVGDTTGYGATATATIDPITGAVTAITLTNPGIGYTLDPVVTITPAPGDITGAGAQAAPVTLLVPNVPDLSMTMEAFQDTPLVNGTLYPYYDVQPQAYRFRILNAANDRMWNLQLYEATSIVSSINITLAGSGYTQDPLVTITPAPGDTTGMGATALATRLDPVTGLVTDHVTGITLVTVGSGYTLPPIVTISAPGTPGGVTATATATIYTGNTEVGMVPAVPGAADFPAEWTVQTLGQPGDILDNRFGGVPDPRHIGPSMVQIGTEGGFLPTPVIWPNTPIGFERNPKNIVIGNVSLHNLFLGPAERADVIIDFSQFVGKTIILYNDAPAAVPAADSRVDYFTADANQTDSGGTVSTLPGYGPNTRTIMAFHVSATGVPTPFDLAALEAEFVTTVDPVTAVVTPGVFLRDQDPILVPQAGYNSAYAANFPDDITAYEQIQSTSLTFRPLDLSTPIPYDQVATPITIINEPKAIAEEFESIYGRMSGFLGVEVPFTNGQNQTTIWYDYWDPTTENVDNTATPFITPIGALGDGTQIWKVTHNGVDTHPIHFHLFDVQLINRVGWDGQIRAPEPNELGWKETVRMNPLEDCIVALRPTVPQDPWGVPDSVRLLAPTMPYGSTTEFKGVDPTGQPVVVVNLPTNFGWEYMWHCHILSHEEMDMMRPVVLNVARTLATASVLGVAVSAAQADLTWTDPTPPIDPATWGNPANEIGYRIERADVVGGVPGTYLPVGTALANATTFSDNTIGQFSSYAYRVVAFNAAGDTLSNEAFLDTVDLPPRVTIDQAISQADPTNASPIHFTVTFSEFVTGFTSGEVILGGTAGATTVGLTTVDNITYDVAVSGMTSTGLVTIDFPAGVAVDVNLNPSLAPIIIDNAVTYDVTAPTVTLALGPGQPNPTNAVPIVFRVTFDEAVTGFTANEILFTGSTAPGALWAGINPVNARVYDVAVGGMTGPGLVSIIFPAGAAQDLAGNPSLAPVVLGNTVAYDAVAPGSTINQAPGQLDPTSVSPIVFRVTFDKPVTGFTASEILFTGSTTPGTLVAAVNAVSTSIYDVSVSGMTGNGLVRIDYPAGAAHDLAGNPSLAPVVIDNTVTYDVTPVWPQIIDDVDPGFSTVGTWTFFSGQGYGGSVEFSAAGTGSNVATWAFGLSPGIYTVAATWSADPNRATDAPYTVLDSTLPIGAVRVNQELVPSDFQDHGVGWKTLGTFAITSNSLVVELSNDANQYVIADAIRVNRLGNLSTNAAVEVLVNGNDVPNSTGLVDFGATIIGVPVTDIFTVRNVGLQPLTLGNTITVPAGFTNPAGFGSTSLTTGQTTTFSVRFGAVAGTSSGVVSFATNDAVANPFTFTVQGTTAVTAIVDNSELGFTSTGAWTFYVGQGYLNNVDFAAAGTGADIGTWSFNVSPGLYSIAATWSADPNRATNSPYTVVDGALPIGTVQVNQELTPNDFTDQGVGWKTLGTFAITSNSLAVQLSNNANQYVIADAVRIERIGSLSANAQIQVLVAGNEVVNGTGVVDFGSTMIGTAVTKTFTVRNVGLQPLTLINAVSVPAGFSTAGFGSTSLTTGQLTTFAVRLDAATMGSPSGLVSFGNSDTAHNPFSFTVHGVVPLIIDNLSATGFATTGQWTFYPGQGYLNSVDFSTAGTGSDVATWTFSVVPGAYQVAATWSGDPNRATNAPYTVYDGATLLATVPVNQQEAPVDFVDQSVGWKILGPFTVSSGSLIVQLSDNANGYVIADAIRVAVPVPLRVDGPEIDHVPAPAVNQGQLAPIVDEAIRRLSDSLGSAVAAALANVTVGLADLPGDLLAEATAGRVLIDRNAAGYGWLVDTTPGDDAEFVWNGRSNEGVVSQGSDDAARVDLLTAVMHELEHTAGYGHSATRSLMSDTLPLGTRRLPGLASSVSNDLAGEQTGVLDDVFATLGQK